jgi:CBS-domain-containing membrane protein
MKIGDAGTGAVTECLPDTDLAAATALMWANDCGVLPVFTEAGELAGIVTDRDICIALVARNRRPSELTAGDVLRAIPKARRSPVITEEWLG